MSFGGLTFRDLEYVVAVADAKSFTAAAERCGVAQPSLSAQVRKVERQLGTMIFERTGREIRLTTSGSAVVEQARNVLQEGRRLFELSRDLSDPLSGTLTLGAIATLGPYLFPHMLGPLKAAYPRLALMLREGLTAELMASVIAGEVDAVLMSLPVGDERFACEPILFEPFLGICPTGSDLSGQDRLELPDLDTDGLILMDEGHCVRDQALALCARAGRSRRHVASIETLRHLVAAGAGHSLLPALAARADPLLDAHVCYRPLADEDAGREIGLVWRASDPRGASFRQFARFLAGLSVPGTRPRPVSDAPCPRPGASQGEAG